MVTRGDPVALVQRASGLVQQEQVQEALALLEQLPQELSNPWLANVLRGVPQLRAATHLMPQAEQQWGAGDRKAATESWALAKQQASLAKGNAPLRIETEFGRAADPWPDLVNTVVRYLEGQETIVRNRDR